MHIFCPEEISVRDPHHLFSSESCGLDESTGDMSGIYFFKDQEALAAYRDTELAKTIPTAYDAKEVRKEVYGVLFSLYHGRGPSNPHFSKIFCCGGVSRHVYCIESFRPVKAADAFQKRCKVFAVDIFHCKKVAAFEFADVVNAADIGMRDLAGNAHFREQPLAPYGIVEFD
jgi:hypothetical protein